MLNKLEEAIKVGSGREKKESITSTGSENGLENRMVISSYDGCETDVE